jgi:hypothetical protein
MAKCAAHSELATAGMDSACTFIASSRFNSSRERSRPSGQQFGVLRSIQEARFVSWRRRRGSASSVRRGFRPCRRILTDGAGASCRVSRWAAFACRTRIRLSPGPRGGQTSGKDRGRVRGWEPHTTIRRPPHRPVPEESEAAYQRSRGYAKLFRVERVTLKVGSTMKHAPAACLRVNGK